MRASYRAAVQWVAQNDNPADTPDDNPTALAEIAGYLTTVLVADLWGRTPEQVADDVLWARRNESLAASLTPTR